MSRFPIEHLIEYKRNFETNRFEPSFHSSAYDRFQTYTLM